MHVNTADNIDICGHFADIAAEAQKNHATRISIRNHHTYCRFSTLPDAEAFESWCRVSGKETHGINRDWPPPYEVAVHHPF